MRNQTRRSEALHKYHFFSHKVFTVWMFSGLDTLFWYHWNTKKQQMFSQKLWNSHKNKRGSNFENVYVPCRSFVVLINMNVVKLLIVLEYNYELEIIVFTFRSNRILHITTWTMNKRFLGNAMALFAIRVLKAKLTDTLKSILFSSLQV